MAEAINRGSYKQVTLGDKWDVIVIGSGIGGLTAAVLLSVYGGKRVLVLERHYVMGGFTHTFRRPGYEWDVGLHYIGQVQDDTSSVRRAFDHVTGGKVRWNAMPEVYDRIIVDGQTFDLIRGLEQYREGMKQLTSQAKSEPSISTSLPCRVLRIERPGFTMRRRQCRSCCPELPADLCARRFFAGQSVQRGRYSAI